MINIDRFNEIISNMKNQTIGVIGDFMLDEYMWGDVNRISPEAPVPVFLFNKETEALGGAGNVSNNIISLNGNVVNFGVIGKDSKGYKLKQLLTHKNIDNSAIITTKSRHTITKTRLIAGNQQLMRVDYEDSSDIDNQLEDKLLNKLKKNLSKFNTIIISDYGKGTLTPRILKTVLSYSDKFIAIDPKYKNFNYYNNASIITPNHKEAEEMVGYKFSTDKEIINAGKDIINKYNLKNLLITLGPKGMALFENNKDVFFIPTYAQDVFDVTGAGDTVISVFSLAISAGATLKEAAIIANISAGYTVSEIGCVAVTEKILKNYIKKYKLL